MKKQKWKITIEVVDEIDEQETFYNLEDLTTWLKRDLKDALRSHYLELKRYRVEKVIKK